MSEFDISKKIKTSNEIDHVTEAEISEELQDEINKAYDHTFNSNIHITEDDRIRWNNAKDKSVSLATPLKDGYMSKLDKSKIDTIEAGAINYIHPPGKIPAGSYMEVTLNDTGHVIAANMSSTLDITATNVISIDNTNVDQFYTYNDAIIETDSIITDEQYPANTYTDIVAYKNKYLSDPVNAKYNEAPVPYAILSQYPHSSYYVSDSETPPTHETIRISPTTNKMYYYDRSAKKWVYFAGVGDLALVGEDGKIDSKYFDIEKKKVNTDIPIGSIQYSPFSRKWAISNGYLPLDGSLVKRSEYPELWKYVNDYSYIIPDELWKKTKEYSVTSVPEFSSGDGSSTFRIPLIGDFLRASADPKKIGTVLYDTNVFYKGTFTTTPEFEVYNDRDYDSNKTLPDEEAYTGCFFLSHDMSVSSCCDGGFSWNHRSNIIGAGGIAHFDSAKILEDVISDENHPRYKYGLFVIKAK